MTHEPIQGPRNGEPRDQLDAATFALDIPTKDSEKINLIVSLAADGAFSPEVRIATIARVARSLLQASETTPVSPVILTTLTTQTFKVVKMLPRNHPLDLRFLNEVVDYAKEKARRFPPRDAASFLVSLVKLRACDLALVEKMAQEVLTKESKLTLRDWADISIACTRMGYRDITLLASLVRNCERRIATVASSIEQEGHTSGPRVKGHVRRDVAILAWMTAKFGLSETECPGLKKMHKASQELLASDMKAVELRAIVDVLWGGARLQVATPSFVRAACAEVARRLGDTNTSRAEELPSIDLATLTYSLAKIGLRYPDDHVVLDCISRSLFPKLRELTPHGLSNLAWSLRAVRYPDRNLPIAVAREMCSPQKIHQANPQGLSTVVLSLAKMGIYDEQVFKTIGNTILTWPELLHPRDNSNLALAFATIGYFNAEIFSRIMTDARTVIETNTTQRPTKFRYNDQDITNIMWACSSREVFDEDFAKACTEYCKSILDTLSPQGLAYLAQYMATFKYSPNTLFETTLDAFLAYSPGNWQDLATMAWSATYLSKTPEPLFRHINQAILERGETAPVESLFSIWWAEAVLALPSDIVRTELMRRDPNELGKIRAAKSASGLFAHLLSAPDQNSPGRMLCERFARDADIISPEVVARVLWLLSHQRPDWLREFFTPEILNKTQEDRHWIRVYQAAVNAELVDPNAPCARLREISAPSKRLQVSARLGRWLQDLKLTSADCAVNQLSAGIFIDAVIDTADSPLAIRWAEPEPTAEIGLPLARPLEPLYRSFEASILKKMGFRVIDVLAVDIEDPATSKAAAAIRSALGEAQPS